MTTKSILINYAGYPASARSLVLDNGLANLAASLINKGHKTVIFDYATVNIIDKLFPHEHRDKLLILTRRIVSALRQNCNPDLADLKNFRNLDICIDQLQEQKVKEIAVEISEYVKAHDVDFVGLKLWLGDGFRGSITIAKQLKKENPDLLIFAGGPHVDFFGEMIFDVCDVFDVLVYGEGEETISMLADYAHGKRKLENIPNLIYKKNGRSVTNPIKRVADLNNIPSPVYDEDVYLAMRGDQKIKMAFIDESRGCPFSCSFCAHPLKSGKKRRTMNPEKVIDRMEEMDKKYGIRNFKFAGSNPPPNLKKSIAKEILRRGVKVTYTTFAHVGGAPDEDFQLIKDSGCYSVFFGIESGSQEILDRSINKRVKVNEIKRAIKAAKMAGLHVVASVIIPAPHETEKTKQETLSLLLEVKPDSVVVCFPSVLLGTDWEKNSKRYGFDLDDRNGLFKKIMQYKMKTFYPPSLWEPFPEYKLNNKSFKELTKETTDFIYTLESSGLLTRLTDDQMFIAKYSGMTPKQFRDKTNRYLSTGDYHKMAGLVAKINEKMCFHE